MLRNRRGLGVYGHVEQGEVAAFTVAPRVLASAARRRVEAKHVAKRHGTMVNIVHDRVSQEAQQIGHLSSLLLRPSSATWTENPFWTWIFCCRRLRSPQWTHFFFPNLPSRRNWEERCLPVYHSGLAISAMNWTERGKNVMAYYFGRVLYLLANQC